MKRIILALLAGAVLVNTAVVANAEPGPPCVDIIDGTTVHFSSNGSPTLVELALAAPSCSQFEYTVVGYDQAGSATPSFTVTESGVGGTSQILFIEVPLNSITDGNVCLVSTTTSPGGRHVFDRAPNADSGFSCSEFDSSGGTQHN